MRRLPMHTVPFSREPKLPFDHPFLDEVRMAARLRMTACASQPLVHLHPLPAISSPRPRTFERLMCDARRSFESLPSHLEDPSGVSLARTAAVELQRLDRELPARTLICEMTSNCRSAAASSTSNKRIRATPEGRENHHGEVLRLLVWGERPVTPR
jgi:hypothetical protein